MNRFWKLVFAALVGLSLLTVLAVGAVVWAAVHGAFDPSAVLVINDEVVEFGSMGLWDAGGAAIGLAIAAVVVTVVVPGSLLIALGATLFGLAVAALCLFGVAAMLLLPLVLPVGLVVLGVWLWSRRQRQQERNRQRALA